MSLGVLLKSATNLRGRYDRIARITFRGVTYQTQVYEDCSDADWDEEFDWPLASQLDPSEFIEIQVLNHNKIFSNRIVGIFRMVLQRLIQERHLVITDSLLDSNNTVLKAQLSLELTYVPPDGSVSQWVNGLQSDASFEGEQVDGLDESFTVQVKGTKRGNENGSVHGSALSLQSISTSKKKKSSAILPPTCGGVADVFSQMGKSGGLDPNQLGVVAGPFGQMLSSKDGGQLSRKASIHSIASAGSYSSKFHQHPKVRIDAKESIKEIDYQIQIRVIEARQLSGMQLDPVCTVIVGSQKKHTAVKEQTNTPFWDEFFVFDFKMPAPLLFDKIINFQVFTGRNLVSQGALIGSFKLDIGTVYSQQDHRFVRRWAVLTDPDETLGASGAGVKGYLKVDITVLGKGDPIKEPPSVKDNDDDIDSNLLLPEGVPAERPKARIVVKIYKAEGLPKMNTGLMANVKKAFTGEVRDLADPYVEVSFAGHKARTSVKKHTYEPEWNEQITFAELFPPLCRRIKVQLKDSDSVTDEVVGTHFIDLSQISNDGANGWLADICNPERSYKKKAKSNSKTPMAPVVKIAEGFMPTFGPCWVNLYGSTRDFSLFDEHNSLNEGLGEGVAYRGRLLMAVQAEMGDSASDASIKQVEVDATPPISDTAAGKEEAFQLFASIYEASMMERKVGEKNIQFEMSVGNYGNTIDGQVIREEKGEEVESDDERFCHSITQPSKATSSDRHYYNLPWEETKPTLHIKFPWQDHRRRLYMMNMMYKICERLEDGLEDVHERVKMEQDDSHKALRKVLTDLVSGCSQFVHICDNKITGGTSGRTKLDRERLKLCIAEVKSTSDQASQVLESVHDNTHIKENLKTAVEFLKRLQTVLVEPQSSLPDVFIWMLSGGKRIAYTRVPAQHIIYSQNDWERGRDSGKVRSIFLRLPGKRGDGPKGWAIQTKLNILLWLGLHKQKKDYLKDAPKGYQVPKGANKMMAPPPNQLVYTEKQKFVLRSHIYQARSLIGSDASGLSDAFARVIFGSMAADTRVIWETRSPTWDQMLTFNEVIIWGDIQEISINPPTIVVEIFDKDIGGDSEFIGRALARPIVKMAHDKYEKPSFPPALEWFEIQRGDEKAGELLAAFELLQTVDEGKCFLPDEVEPVSTSDGPIVPVPDGIRPIMKKHRIEVLFWGVREMKRVNLTTVDRPQVDIDCAGHVVQSTVIVNAKRNPNFSNPVAYFDVDLPENERYCPPLTVRVRDCRTFGRFTLVGTHVVNSLHRYLQDPEKYLELQKKTDEGGEKTDGGDGGDGNGLNAISMPPEGDMTENDIVVVGNEDDVIDNEKDQETGGEGDPLSNNEVMAEEVDEGNVEEKENMDVIEEEEDEELAIQGEKEYETESLLDKKRSLPPSPASHISKLSNRSANRFASPVEGAMSRPSSKQVTPFKQLVSRPGSTAGSAIVGRSPAQQSTRAPSGKLSIGSGKQLMLSTAVEKQQLQSPGKGSTKSLVLSDGGKGQKNTESPSLQQANEEPVDNVRKSSIGSRKRSHLSEKRPSNSSNSLLKSRCGTPLARAQQSITGSHLKVEGNVINSHNGSRRQSSNSKGTGVVSPKGEVYGSPPIKLSPKVDSRSPVTSSQAENNPEEWDKNNDVDEIVVDETVQEEETDESAEITLESEDILEGENGDAVEEGMDVAQETTEAKETTAEETTDPKKEADKTDQVVIPDKAGDVSRPQSPAVPAHKDEPVIIQIGQLDDDNYIEREKIDDKKDGKKKEKSEKDKEEDDDEESLDWWSRYYETVKDIEREEHESTQKETAAKDEKEKKDKKNKDVEPAKPSKRPNPKITRIKIFKMELENNPQFNGFNDWLYSFPLFRGKKTSDDEDDDHRIVGKFKGALKVWKHPLPKFLDNDSPTGSFSKLPSNEPVNVLVRVYIVRALDLHPTDVNGKADPYLIVTCGKQKTKDRDNYVPKQLNPIFGRAFDFEAIIPMDNMLTVGIYDYDLVGSDDLIGETKIDIENRFYSRHRPICGLSETYTTFGFNKWRDPMKPTQILARLCKDEGLDGPHYVAPGKCRIENYIFIASPNIVDEAGNPKPSDEPAALKALHNFEVIPKKGYSLTPEHVETRSMYNPEKPGIEQGKVEMWIDMFAMDAPSPGAPVDITPRKPAAFELRVIIWNTEDVIMDEVNLITGEACSDIYVKGWIEGMKDEKQQTDVHYRSLTGEGNFNWRFLFPFQYQKAEEKIVIKRKASIFSWDESEEKVPARLTLQVWDADAFSADDFIGDLCLDLVRMPRGAKTSKTCNLDTMKTDRPISLFKLKHIKAWWPFAVNTDLEEIELAGKVEAELELLTQEEAEKAPAGMGREEPQPLDKPNRPDTSFTWFMNPFKSLRYMIWEQYKFCLLKFLVIGLLIALMGLFFYSMPGYTVKKIFNA